MQSSIDADLMATCTGTDVAKLGVPAYAWRLVLAVCFAGSAWKRLLVWHIDVSVMSMMYVRQFFTYISNNVATTNKDEQLLITRE